MNTKLLRQKILDLAIRGKLTEQKKSDGTTKDLLASIAASSACHAELVSASPSSSAKKNSKATERSVILERTSNVILERTSNVIASKAKQSKKSKPAEPKTIIPLNKDEAPFEIPENWEWVRLGDVCNSISDIDHKMPAVCENGIPYVSPLNFGKGNFIDFDGAKKISKEDFEFLSRKCKPERGDIIFPRYGTIGVCKIVETDIDFLVSYSCAVLKSNGLIVDFNYLFFVLMSPLIQETEIKRYVNDTTQANVGIQSIKIFLFPLPPLAEQKRIVEAIESAFAEITAIENNQELLKKHIKQGRQKILDLAIRGKLTEQKKSDGTTKDLLTQIQDERRETNDESDAGKKGSSNVILERTSNVILERTSNVIASEAKQSKKSKPAEPKTIIPLNKDEAPFEIPETWEWVKLGDVCDKLIDGDHNPPKGISKQTEYLMLSSRNVNDNKVVDLENVRYLTKEMFEEENKRTNLIEGDILFTSVGSLGRSCVYDGNGNFCFQRSVTIVHTLIFNKYLKYFFDSDYYQKVIVENATGTAQLGFYLEQMRKSLVAIPPLAEQQRIVAAIEQAFAEFDAMEKL